MSEDIDLRHGDWQRVLADVECDALISDPPFSARVHDGQRTGGSTRRTTIEYGAVTRDWCRAYVASWAPRTRYWAVTFSDHTGAGWWEAEWEAAGWYVFAPVLWIRSNPTPRIAGDGPTSACDYITVARPRRRLEAPRMGSRPGYYITQNDPKSVIVPGGKQLDPMRKVVIDYSRPGDLVCDPCSGGATTLLAAHLEGRRSIGAERSYATAELAAERIDKHLKQQPLFAPQLVKAEQVSMFDAAREQRDVDTAIEPINQDAVTYEDEVG